MSARLRQAGFSLVELLVAGTLMVVILTALGSLLATTSGAYRANEEVSDRQQTADAAAQLLSYEIGLAGYRGSDQAANSREFKTLGLLPESTLTIVRGATTTAPDTITVRYYEDRFTTSTSKISVTFSVATNSAKGYSLYRHDISNLLNTKKPAIQNVTNLKVVSYLRKDGVEAPSATTDTFAGLRLELTFSDGFKKQAVVGLNNAQTVPVLPTL